MKLDIHKFMNLNKFLPGPISNLFQKGKMMILAKSLMTILIAATFAITGCMQQDSTEMGSSEVEQVSNLVPSEGDEQDTLIEVSLGGASRAERFMGSYDEIERLALDVVRNYGNKEDVKDLFEVLQKRDIREPANWSRRFKNHQEKLKSGDVYQVAEVVRNLALRDQAKGLSAGEKTLYNKALDVLVSELAFALNTPEEKAMAKVADALS